MAVADTQSPQSSLRADARSPPDCRLAMTVDVDVPTRLPSSSDVAYINHPSREMNKFSAPTTVARRTHQGAAILLEITAADALIL